MNKNNKFIFIFYLYIHTSLFFYFLFFGLGPAQPIGAGLDLASPARVTGPSQWPGWAKCGARVKWFHACIHCAKVIKLPSHSVLWSFNFKERKGMKSWRTCFWSGEDGCNAGGNFRLLDTFTSAFPFCSCAHSLLSFSSRFWDNEGTENEGAGFCGYWFLGRFLQRWKQWQNQLSSLCCSSAFLLFQFVLCLPLFSGFFLWVLLQFFPLVLYFSPWFCFFRLGLAWVFPRFLLQTPCFSSSVCWVFLLCSSNDFRFNSPEILLPLPLLCSVFYRAPACRKPLPLFINLWAGSWARDRGVVALNCRICFLLNRSGPCETEGMVNSGIKTASSCIKKMTDYESVP